jgi:hypothetical protein
MCPWFGSCFLQFPFIGAAFHKIRKHLEVEETSDGGNCQRLHLKWNLLSVCNFVFLLFWPF